MLKSLKLKLKRSLSLKLILKNSLLIKLKCLSKKLLRLNFLKKRSKPMMPEWLKIAYLNNVISKSEAHQLTKLHQQAEKSNQNEFPIPPNLHQAAQRLHLFELESPSKYHH
ncbi:hypothetical protein BA3_0004 [Thalassomonas phage BA3]|uniref:hypothetical protein n=1 Tax=Thalassomonas phage BA3 TaxID=469660 RepID=UPI00015D9589|nr:hypothetical protein BA3_0004 [Thalassomonas phage BA3]ABV74289.1 hypothetical protein BA3_0004 [Thalassomonas phage BA3]